MSSNSAGSLILVFLFLLPVLWCGTLSANEESYKLQDVWLSFEISSSVQEKGGFHPQLLKEGWSWLFEKCSRLNQLGYRQFIFHRPLGEKNDGRLMDFASSKALEGDPGIRRLTDGFKPALDEFLRDHDCRVILYFGSLKGPTTSEALKQKDMTGWFDLTNGTLLPLLENDRVEIAFDNSNSFRSDSVNWKYLELLNQWMKVQDRRLWLESVPKL